VTTTSLPASKPLPNGKRDRLGMLCPHCGGDTGVIDSRAADGNTIRRKRVCFTCGHRIRTFEIVSDTNPATSFRDNLRRQAAELRAAADRIERILDEPKEPP
jgi:transcriptional regulator NrdR family protein